LPDPRKFAVIKGGPKKPEKPLEPVVCLLCRKKHGVTHGEVLEIRTGGYWKKGRMVGFRKALICARCFARDGTIEIIGYLT